MQRPVIGRVPAAPAGNARYLNTLARLEVAPVALRPAKLFTGISERVLLMAHNKKADHAENARNSNRPSLSKKIQEGFGIFAQSISHVTGRPATFLLALLVVIVWAISGPLFGFSDTWQLVINTGTTIVTFLMVFLIQNTQNRDTLAIQLKLAELIIAMKGVSNEFAVIEDLTDEELEKLHNKCREQAEHTLHHLTERKAKIKEERH
jgi:low affinity Fe/Cu permease